MRSSRRRFLAGAGSGLILAAGPRSAEAVFSALKSNEEAAVEAALSEVIDAEVWDGTTGITSVYFNKAALLPWDNKGGDWTDSAGVAQGSSAYAAFVSKTPGPFSANVTPLVQRWYDEGNTGAYLKASGNAVIASRTHPDTTLRPVLLLTDAKGAVTRVPCLASALCDLATVYGTPGTTCRLGSGKNLVLQFDLPFPKPAFVSAKLQLTSVQNYFEALSLVMYELRPPKMFDGGTPQMGLAARYASDKGIQTDPDVYFSGFSDFPEGTLVTDPSATTDAQFPSAVHSVYNVGWIAACTINHRWSTKREWLLSRNPYNGLVVRQEAPNKEYMARANDQCPDELYFRYYLKLKAGYQCHVEGKKLPGLAGRYGTWTGNDKSGYYAPHSGNGGSPTSGRYDGKVLSGWSMRHHAYVGVTDANPLKDLVALNYYAYHAAMTGYYGDYWRWGNRNVGYVCLEEERWYCIEHYVKVNSLTGPADAWGNQTPVADGIVRGWIDGVKVFEKTNALLRRHPAIRVDEVWLDHYHGGTQVPEAKHAFAMAGLVVAREYIGPQTGIAIEPPVTEPPPPVVPGGTTATPAWLAGKAVNQWVTVPGSALSASADVAAQAAAGLCGPAGENLGYGTVRKGILDFSGGALKKSGSEMLIFGGGGAGSWAGNDVRGLRLEDAAPAWRTLVKPSPVSGLWPAQGDGRVPHPYRKDNLPNARHSYWQPQFVDSLDTFMSIGCQNVWETDNGTFSTVDSAKLGGSWNPAGSHPNIPQSRNYDGSWVCQDPSNENIYASTQHAIHRFAPGTNTWTTVHSSGNSNGIERGFAGIDTKRKLLLRIGYWKSNNRTPVTFNLVTGALTEATLSGPHAGGPFDRWAGGIAYDPVLDKFIVFLDDGHLYGVSYVSDSEWRVERLALTGVAPSVQGSTVHGGGGVAIRGRMRYVPNLRGVCIVQRFDQPAYFVRTAAV